MIATLSELEDLLKKVDVLDPMDAAVDQALPGLDDAIPLFFENQKVLLEGNSVVFGAWLALTLVQAFPEVDHNSDALLIAIGATVFKKFQPTPIMDPRDN